MTTPASSVLSALALHPALVRALEDAAAGAALKLESVAAHLGATLPHGPGTTTVAGALLLYAAFVALNWGRALTGPRRVPASARIVYNATLATVTLAYAVLMTMAVAESATGPGSSLWHAACARGIIGDYPRLGFLYSHQVTLRLVELVDTVLIVDSGVGGAGLTFLHCFHHGASLALARLHVVDATPSQWITLLTNAWVHVAMYAYYAVAAAGVALPRVKRFVTRLQIAQFVLLLVVYGAVFAARAYGVVECYATTRSTVAALSLISFYLVLFMRFYRRAYAPKTSAAPARQPSAATAPVRVAVLGTPSVAHIEAEKQCAEPEALDDGGVATVRAERALRRSARIVT